METHTSAHAYTRTQQKATGARRKLVLNDASIRPTPYIHAYMNTYIHTYIHAGRRPEQRCFGGRHGGSRCKAASEAWHKRAHAHVDGGRQYSAHGRCVGALCMCMRVDLCDVFDVHLCVRESVCVCVLSLLVRVCVVPSVMLHASLCVMESCTVIACMSHTQVLMCTCLNTARTCQARAYSQVAYPRAKKIDIHT
jgi:hypothetical protein